MELPDNNDLEKFIHAQLQKLPQHEAPVSLVSNVLAAIASPQKAPLVETVFYFLAPARSVSAFRRARLGFRRGDLRHRAGSGQCLGPRTSPSNSPLTPGLLARSVLWEKRFSLRSPICPSSISSGWSRFFFCFTALASRQDLLSLKSLPQWRRMRPDMSFAFRYFLIALLGCRCLLLAQPAAEDTAPAKEVAPAKEAVAPAIDANNEAPPDEPATPRPKKGKKKPAVRQPAPWQRELHHSNAIFGEHVVVKPDESIEQLILLGGTADIQGTVERESS